MPAMSDASRLAHTLLLDAPIGYSTPKAKGPLACHVVRDLNPADLDVLANPPRGGFKAPSLQRIRNTHHMLARLIAEGRKNTEISMISGFSSARIAQLQHDPMFQELVAYYAAQVEAQYVDVHARLADLGTSTIEELRERLEETPEKFSVRELLDIMKETLDRSTAPAKGGTKGTTIEIKFVGANDAHAGEPAKGTILDLDIISEE
jgi:hypothetical protein